MKFLYPQYLYALFVVAIPIIIHLFNFRKFKTIKFSNVKFLKDIKEKTKAQSELKHLLILFSRILAVASIVMAFAQPYIPVNENTLGKSTVSVFLDNSFSMNAEAENGRAFNIAQNKALEIVKGYASEDEFQYLDQNLLGRNQKIVDKTRFSEEVNKSIISSSSHSLSTILKRQINLLNTSKNKKELFIISDFDEGFFDPIALQSIDSSISTYLIPINTFKTDNVYIDSCWLNTPNPQANKNIQLFAKIINTGHEVRENVAIKLFLDNQQVALSNIDVYNEEVVSLDFMVKDTSWIDAMVQIQDYPITFDDNYNLSFKIKNNIKVLNIFDNESNKNLDKLFNNDDYIDYNTASINNINYEKLTNFKLIILDGLNNINDGLLKSLTKATKFGASIIIFPSGNTTLDTYNTFSKVLNTDNFVRIIDAPLKLKSINHNSELFNEVFDKIDKNLNLPSVNKYFKLSRKKSLPRTGILSFENNEHFITEYKVNKGKVYMSSVGLDKSFSNFTSHSLFVPILYNLALYAGGKQKIANLTSDNFIAGFNNLNNQNTYRISKENFEFIPEYSNNRLWIYDQVKEDGHYFLKNENITYAHLAFNYDRKESQIKKYSAEKLKQITNGMPNIKVVDSTNKDLTSLISSTKNGQQLWLYFIISAILFLIIETLLIRFL